MHKEIEIYLSHLLPELQKAGISIDEQQEIDYGVQLRVSRHNYKSILNIYYSQKKGISTIPMGLNNPLKNCYRTCVVFRKNWILKCLRCIIGMPGSVVMNVVKAIISVR